MMQFKALDLPEEWAWVRARANPLCVEDSQGIVAYDEKGQIAACMVADSFAPESCHAHIAIGNPLALKYGFLEECFTHLFKVCNRKRVFGMVPGTNKKALRFDTHIGFTEVARIPHGYSTGVDYVILCMERDECRWLADSSLEEAA